MELVTILEATAREVYTGAIGIASPVSGLELNVAIRTFELADGSVWLGVGGGVVADSDPQRELEECFDKARPLLAAIGAELGRARCAHGGVPPVAGDQGADQASAPSAGVFETILLIDGGPVELEAHLGRLAASTSCLYGSQPSARLGAEVVEAAKGLPGSQRLRVRVWPSEGPGLKSEVSVVPAPEAFCGVPGPCVALVPSVLAGGLGRHKWHDRHVVADRRTALGLGEHDQLLFLDEGGDVLETEQANVFVVHGGVVRTAPVDGRILAGTTREVLIRLALSEGFELSEQAVSLCEMALAEEVFVTSSIRGLCAVGELHGSRSFTQGPVTARLAKALWTSWKRSSRSDACFVANLRHS
jgi:para-aminobenzoate synthetase/4-amino-4-deoxychorismate lyase